MRFLGYKLELVLFLVFLSGCSGSINSYALTPSVSTIPPTSTFTAIPSQEPTVTQTPTGTVTPTSQPTATIILTPLPTLSKDKIRAKFDQLYNYNDGCSLPCWWGITPGVITWDETLHFLSQFDEVGGVAEVQQYPLTKDPLEFTLARWQFPSPYNDFKTSADFEIQNGIVVAIRIWGDVGDWMFPAKKLYADYGEPNRVFIVAGRCQENQNFCDATLYLLYDENRFMSVYGVLGTISSNIVSLCIAGNSNLTMWSPDVNIDLDAQKLPDSEFTLLQTQIFSNNPKSNEIESCLDVPIELWRK